MTTQFIHTEIPSGIDGYEWHIDGNSKVAWNNGTYADPRPNALSLPHVSSCPGSTPACLESCYVFGLRKNAPEVYATYERNARTLGRVLLGKYVSRARALGKWIAEHCPGGFRWHVSGDVQSERHAKFIAVTCMNSLKVQHWIYTRTLECEVLAELTLAQNLAVNLSVDRDNWERAGRCVELFPTARLCWLLKEGERPPLWLRPGDVVFPDYPMRGRDLDDPTQHPAWRTLPIEQKRKVCPADFFGQSEQHRCGPCTKCLFPRKAEV